MKKNERSRKYTLPATIDLEQINVWCDKNDLKEYKLIYFLSQVYTKRNQFDYVPLHSKLLERVMGSRDYTSHINFLDDEGIIDIEDTYLQSEKCKGYRLLGKHRRNGSYEFTMDDDNFNRYWGSFALKHNRSQYVKEGELMDYMKDVLENDVSLHVPSARYMKESKIDFEDVEWEDKVEKDFDRICKNEIKTSMKNTNLRFNSVFTRLPREMRMFTRIDGEPAVGVDITNSQPLNLTLSLERLPSSDIHDFYSNITLKSGRLKERDINKWMNVIKSKFDIKHDNTTYVLQSRRYRRNTPDYRTHLKSIKKAFKRPSDTLSSVNQDEHNGLQNTRGANQPLLEHALNGTFYEHLQELMSLETRQEAKDKYMLMYDEPKKWGAIWEPLVEYPELKTFLDEVKAKKSQVLARFLQMLESLVFVFSIGGRLKKENIKFFTVHDSVYVKPEHVERTEQIIKEVYREWFGITPATHTERCYENLNEYYQMKYNQKDEIRKLKEERAKDKAKINELEERLNNTGVQVQRNTRQINATGISNEELKQMSNEDRNDLINSFFN